MLENLEVRLLSPISQTIFSKVNKVALESSNDSFEIYPEHTELCSVLKIGKIMIFTDIEELIFEVYNASIKYNNEENSLLITCLEYSHEKDVIFSFQEINQIIKSDSQSLFYLQLLENNEIALEKID